MKLNNFAKIINNKNKHKLVAVGYAFTIALAFILSTTRNNSVNASVSGDDIKHIEEYDQVAATETGYNDANLSYLENLKNLLGKKDEQKTTKGSELATKLITKEIEVSKGDNFIGILTNKIGMDYNEATKAVTSFKKVFDPRALRIGQKIKFDIVYNEAEEKFVSLEKILIEPSVGTKYTLVKTVDAEYAANSEIEELVEEVVASSGTIEGALSSSMNKAGIPSQISARFVNIFSFTVDFRRDIKAGDKFEIVYENKINSEGKVVKTGDILYASISLRNNTFSLYRFEDSNGNVDYYNEKGTALKRTLHRKPLAFQSARVSSPFGKRRHPIYKDLRIHWGIDYAAPRGTAIFAAGDGVVQVAKYNGGYGNYVRIRHNSEYSTAYGHMHRFATGIRPGVRVKQGQIIGYVGNTGRSTGPHLHYEVVQNGKRVNPAIIKAATGENLTGKNLTKFQAQIADLKRTHTNLFASAKEQKKVAQK